MATRVQYQCSNCKCTAHVKPPKCWHCGSVEIRELLSIAEREARAKMKRWNNAVRGDKS